jgi:uncharacterized delta-60 repeat protein
MHKTSIALALGLSIAGVAAAHDGNYIESFGDHGREQVGFSPSLLLASGFVSFVDLAIQADNKIVVSASVANTGSTDMGALRLNPNGTLDTNFGTQGQTIVAFDGGGTDEDVASSVLVQPNGRIVLCGQASGDPALGGDDFGIVRLTAGGLPDSQFSGDGKATVAFDIGPTGSRDDFAVRCSLQGDGKIVVAGRAQTDASGTRMAVARLNSDGSRDTGFNGSGTATVDFGPGFTASIAFSVKSFPDNSTLLIGQAAGVGASTSRWAFAHLDDEGQLDTSFGNGGIVVFDPGVPSYQAFEALDAVVLPDNSFVAAGVMMLLPAGENFDYGVFKFLPNGFPDTNYGNGGGQVIAFDLGSDLADLAVEAIVDAQGRVVLAGISNGAAVPFTTSMVRLTTDGELDPTFGSGGKLIVPSAPPSGTDLGDQGTALALNTDGSILVGSIANGPAPGYLAGIAKIVGDTLFESGFEID